MRTWTLALALMACAADEDDKSDDTGAADDTTGDDTGGDDTTSDTSPGTGDDTGGDDTNVTCATLDETSLADGATDVEIIPNLRADFDVGQEGIATFSLAEAGGAGVTLPDLTWLRRGRAARVRPLAPLKGDTDYVWTIDYACGTETIGFTTVDLGPEVTPEVDATYVVDLNSGAITQPAGLGTLLSGLLAGTDLGVALAVSDVDPTSATLDFEVGVVTDDGMVVDQDLCTQTFPVPGTDFSGNPLFYLSVTSLNLPVAGITIQLDNLALFGRFTNGGDTLEDITIEGVVDTALLGQALGLGSGAGAVCNFLAIAGANCQPCIGGTGNTCIAVRWEGLVANDADPFVLTPRTANDVATDPTCN